MADPIRLCVDLTLDSSGLHLPTSIDPPVPETGITVHNKDGDLAWKKADGSSQTIRSASTSNSHTYELPNRSGMFALREDINQMTFGDGSDGNVRVSTVVALTRPMFYRNLIIEPGGVLLTNGYSVRVYEALTNMGKITRLVGHGGHATEFMPGDGGCLREYLLNDLGAGTAGTAGSTCMITMEPAYGHSGGIGGSAGSTGDGAIGGQGGQIVNRIPRHLVQHLIIGNVLLLGGAGGRGGPAGRGDCGDLPGFGGGGGQGGGVNAVYCRHLMNDGIIEAPGGNGGNGYSPTSGKSSGGGGAGGGGGGFNYIAFMLNEGKGLILAPGGQGGRGGIGFGLGTNALDGSAGANGRSLLLDLSTLQSVLI